MQKIMQFKPEVCSCLCIIDHTDPNNQILLSESEHGSYKTILCDIHKNQTLNVSWEDSDIVSDARLLSYSRDVIAKNADISESEIKFTLGEDRKMTFSLPTHVDTPLINNELVADQKVDDSRLTIVNTE